MTDYDRAKKMHQYYRDALSQEYSLPDIGNLPYDWVMSVLSTGTSDTIAVAEQLFTVSSGLAPEKDRALKLILTTIAQANMILEKNSDGTQRRPPETLIRSIENGLIRALSLDPKVEYFVIATQLLYRLGRIEDVMMFCDKHPDIVQSSPTLLRIVAMVNIVEENYEAALPHLIQLVEDKKTANLPLVSLMSLTCTHKLGGIPDAPIDFSTMYNHEIGATAERRNSINWVISPSGLGRKIPTVLIACDNRYFFEHALALIYSIYESNKGELLVHVHCYNPNLSAIRVLEELSRTLPELSLTATSEIMKIAPGNAHIQFATRRFVAADYLLNYFDSPLVIIDADALFRGSWASRFGEKAVTHEIIASSFEAAPFWEKISAGFLYFGSGDIAKRYLHETARFIAHNLACGNYLWFLDQIALSACFEKYVSDAPGALLSDDLIDITHRNDSPVWFVTTIKEGSNTYNAYKEQLCRKYRQLPLSKPSDAFQELSKTRKPVYFLQVGAMDGASYDPIFPFASHYLWNGILIEPLPDMMDRLKANYQNREGLIFENVAVSDQIETKFIYRIPTEVIKANNLPEWLQGMSTFSDTKLAAYESFVIKQPVPCVTLTRLLDKHRLPRIDVLQIDTEGYDYIVFKQFDFASYRPLVVNMEVVNLNAEDLAALEQSLFDLGYVFYQYDMDMIAIDKGFFAGYMS